MNVRPASTDSGSLRLYSDLFSLCFPTAKHLTEDYLKWLYILNPVGSVIGFDAWDGETLAAHYACIPTSIELNGSPVLGMLSLNTATHPAYQGKGLFTRLAELTYAAGADQGCTCVYGVANANSTPGFIRKLGFQFVAPLEARIGVGKMSVNWERASRNAIFRRIWTRESFLWRCFNPANPVFYGRRSGNIVCLSVRTGYPAINAYGEVPVSFRLDGESRSGMAPFNLFLGLFPEGCCPFARYFAIPERLRFSPLNLIFRPLNEKIMKVVDPRCVLFSFADFDAY